jgi:hypothetical protein
MNRGSYFIDPLNNALWLSRNEHLGDQKLLKAFPSKIHVKQNLSMTCCQVVSTGGCL